MKTASPTRALGRVLVVEDERDVAELIRYNLGKEGYDVVITASGTDAVKQARETRPDIVLLDIMVPHLNGWEVCRRLKQDAETRNIPVIMVTGRAEEGDKVLGFEMGADDYVTKPFSPRELVARVRAVLRRGGGEELADLLLLGDLEIDVPAREVRLRGKEVRLAAREFELLAFLARHPRRVFTREQLMQSVWGYTAAIDTGTLSVHVRRLREKIEDDPRVPRRIETVWNVGYRFVA